MLQNGTSSRARFMHGIIYLAALPCFVRWRVAERGIGLGFGGPSFFFRCIRGVDLCGGSKRNMRDAAPLDLDAVSAIAGWASARLPNRARAGVPASNHRWQRYR